MCSLIGLSLVPYNNEEGIDASSDAVVELQWS